MKYIQSSPQIAVAAERDEVDVVADVAVDVVDTMHRKTRTTTFSTHVTAVAAQELGEHEVLDVEAGVELN